MPAPNDPSAGLPVPGGQAQDLSPGGHGKAMRSLTGLMDDISACRADILRRETVVADLQRRLQGELQPLRDAMLEARVDTFRVLGKHLASGMLNRRAHKELELALYDFANALEAEFDVDLRADRARIFPDQGADDGYGESPDGEDGDADDEGPDPGAYRESDFDTEREGRGDWSTPGPRDGRRERGARGGGSGRAGAGKTGSGGKAGSGKGPGGADPKESRDEALAGEIRALYLLLARALHPDKESDPARLGEKTAWMQKVTAAYAARDLARLLDILAANPLDAVGPYLSQAPLKTVQSFAKRLRRELEALRHRLAFLDAGLDPLLASLMKNGAVNETAYNILLSQVRKELKFMKQRRDIYRTSQGVLGLVEALRAHPWNELM
jgi:hypothetical protein